MTYMFNLKDYETVAARVLRFQAKYPNGVIQSRVISHDQENGLVYCEAKVYRDISDPMPSAIDGAYGIMKTFPSSMQKFYVEDTLSSATGRALSLILEVTHKPTREDMSKVETVQVPREDDPWTVKDVPQAQRVAVADAGDAIVNASNAEVPMCKCGEPMKWGEGTSKASGKPWGKYACPIWNKSTGSGCDEVIWYQISPSGTWQPQQGWSK